MLASSIKTDQDYFHDDVTNLDSYNIEGRKIKQQENVKSSCASSSVTTPSNLSLDYQSDPWPRQTIIHTYNNISFIQPYQSDSTDLDCNSSNMDTNEWQTTDSHLTQALPGQLAAPLGWRSEIVHSSLLSSNNIESNLYDNTSNFTEKHEEYKTLKSSDTPPIIFSSNNEVNRIGNQRPSTTIHENNIQYCGSPIDNNLNQEYKTIFTEDQRNLVTNIENPPPPLVVHKKSVNNVVTYQQNVSVRYLQAPTPPPPGPLIIREIYPPIPPRKSPVQIRQRPPPARTPPPLVLRERPPPRPPRPPSQVIERLLPPPPRPPRRVIFECLGQCPPKPADVVIERWLPYRRSDQRRIFFERAPAPFRPPQEPNMLVVHEQAHARIQKEFINQGVTRADPQIYLQYYGAELASSHNNSQYTHLVDEATRALPPPPPPQPLAPIINPPYPQDYHPSYPTGHPPPYHPNYPPAPYHPNYSPVPYHSNYPPPSYHPNYSPPTLPYGANMSPSYGHGLNSYPSPFNYPSHQNNPVPSWGQYNPSSCSSTQFPSYQLSSSYYSPQTIRVNSDNEFDHVLSNLTNGRVPNPLRSSQK